MRNGDAIHEFAAAYALDALATDEVRAFEDHLAGCSRCREDLVVLQDGAGALAVATVAPAPPRALRRRILVAARRERRHATPLRRRHVILPSAFAAVAACAAIAIGGVAWSLSRDLDGERAARAERERAVLVLVQPDAVRVPLDGAEGAVVRAPAGDAALVVNGLAPAPRGKVYEAWVVEGGRTVPAGVFAAAEPATVHALTRPLPDGAIVTVTLEDAPGVASPTSSPIFRSPKV